MGKKLRVFAQVTIVLFIITLFSANEVFAVSVSVDDYPQTITHDPFTLTVTVTGASPATNYLRVDLYKENTTNYFGETFNGTDWYGSSTYSQYFPIVIDSTKKWSGQLEARAASPTQTEYDGQGSYRIRIRRYTSSGGSDATEANSSSVSVAINIPLPSPSPSPETSKATSPSPSPSSSPQRPPSPKPTVLAALKSSSPSLKVLGEATQEVALSQDPSPQSSPNIDKTTQNFNSSIKIASIFVGLGLILLALSAAMFLWYKRLQQKEASSGQNSPELPEINQ